jgi:hypothetical protein
MADFRENVAPPLGKGGVLDVVGAAGPAGWVMRGGTEALAGLSPEERQNRNAYKRVFLGFRTLKTGAAASEAEKADILDSFEGAKSPAEIGAAIEQMHNFIQRNKDSVRAENPEATAEYESNLRTQSANDRANRVKRERP